MALYFSFWSTARLVKFAPMFSVSVGIGLSEFGFRFPRSLLSEYEIRASSAGPAVIFQIQGISFLSLRECRLYLIQFHEVLDVLLHDFSQFGPSTRVRVGSRILCIPVSSNFVDVVAIRFRWGVFALAVDIFVQS